MRFAAFEPGMVITTPTYVVQEAEVLQFAAAYDPQWFHTDPQAARDGRFGGLIASGWHTCSIAMRLLADQVLAGSESYASPGIAYIRWPHPVRPGDVLQVRATVLEARVSRSQPGLGLLRWRWQMHKADGVEVLDLEATSLFDLTRAPGAPG